MMKAVGLMAVVALSACAKDDGNEDSGAVVLIGPEMSHTPPADALFDEQSLDLSVDATDEDGVNNIDVFFRTEGSTYWENRPLEEGEAGTWQTALPGPDVQKPGLEYYFRAVDLGVPSAVSYLPIGAADEPFTVAVKPRGAALPYVEGFEESTSLFQVGWVNVANGFQGYPWEISTLQAYGGVQSVSHARGTDDVDPMDDYLISPAIDLSQDSEVQVSWMERGSSLSEGMTPSLWISTGSRDPADGEFELVEELVLANNSGWRRSDVINLSAWAGAAEVYLAWRYEGQSGGDWYIDDVSVKALSCDAQMSLSWAPVPVHPSESAALTIHLDNPVDSACEAVSVSLAVDPSAGVLDAETVDAGALPALGSTSADFVLTIDENWPDNTYLPIEAVVEADGEIFIETLILTVGEASEARLDLNVLLEGLVQVSLGVGDPDSPVWEELLYAAAEPAGLLSLAFDVTDKESTLPPAAGESRWWARVSMEGEALVEAFEIDFGDTTYSATLLPYAALGQEVLVYVPEPPDPMISMVATNPSAVEPGDSVSVTLGLYNAGAVTAGAVTATLMSAHPSVTVVSGGAFDVGSGLWGGGETRNPSQAFEIDVDPDHVDSTNVDFELWLDDGVEQWSLPFEVAVPWPVMKIMALRIDDSAGGDNDGLLEPGESAELEIDIFNAGDLSATGLVTVALSLGDDTTAAGSVTAGSDSLGTMAVGKERTADFSVSADSTAALGEVFDLELVFQDDLNTYTSEIELILGELPWLPLASMDDTAGDSNGYGFDILNAQWRTDGTTMEFRFEAASAFDQSKDYAEAWMVSSGGDYQFYRLMLQGSSASLQGYDSGFINLAQPALSFPDATHAVLEWNIADMGQLTTTNLSVGIGAGWCQVATGSFCDHFPNGWGYYYHSTYNTFGFFPISW